MRSFLDQKHQQVAANYYDQAILNNSLQHYWHSRRFQEAKKILEAIKANKILDVGCHGGKFTSVIFKTISKAEIFGIDISRKAINYASNRYPQINFQVGRAEKIPFPNSNFDLVTCFEVLEHLKNPPKVINEVKRILKKNGVFLILVPTENFLFRAIWFFWSKWGPGRVWHQTHVQKFNNNKLDKLLTQLGFKITTRKTFLLDMLLLIKAVKN